MSLRLKSWLLLALLLFTANFGVSVSRVTPLREPNAIVFVDSADEISYREVDQSRLRFLEAQPSKRKATTLNLAWATSIRAVLFQRPPPSRTSVS